MTAKQQQREQVREVTKRTCRLCGKPYVWPKGSRRPGAVGPCCQPTLEGMER